MELRKWLQCQQKEEKNKVLRWFKCFLFGHSWEQEGASTIQHFYGDIEIGYKDHFLFRCSKCGKIKEYQCSTTYDLIKKENKETKCQKN